MHECINFATLFAERKTTLSSSYLSHNKVIRSEAALIPPYGTTSSQAIEAATSMASFGPTNLPNSEDMRHAGKGTTIFSFTCVGLTGAALFSVLFFFCYQIRNRAPVAAAGAETGTGDRPRSVDLTKLPEFAYTRSARRSGSGDGAQCSVCLGTVLAGEMVRMLPLCKHLYHVECIDMWLASHDTCPLCRAEVEPPEDDGQPEMNTELPV
ncbi:unnamed protein product [Alopecurus aequalis]